MTQTKLNSQGIIQELKSNNSYLVSVNGSVKHISGDHIRLLSEGSAIDNVIMENDSTSVGESILLEGGGSDTEDASYLIQEDIVTGDYTSAGSQDKTAQNELFDSLDDDVLDFSESNPFGDAGGT